MRYFLDTEYNGWGGALLSLALVPDDGEELYLTLDWSGMLEPWVEQNVLPYLDTVPESLVSPRMTRGDAENENACICRGLRRAAVVGRDRRDSKPPAARGGSQIRS